MTGRKLWIIIGLGLTAWVVIFLLVQFFALVAGPGFDP